MLQAILKGKVRNQISPGESETTWRAYYRATEDFLTAAAFARLSYLPAITFWRVLTQAVTPPGVLPHEPGELLDIEFWPRWTIGEPSPSMAKIKEPDVFVSFRSVDLIVEAKTNDNVLSQNAEQWAGEFRAYKNSQESAESKDAYLVAVGGFLEPVEDFRSRLEAQANRLLVQHARGTKVVGKWYEFAAVSTRESLTAVLADFRSLLTNEGVVVRPRETLPT